MLSSVISFDSDPVSSYISFHVIVLLVCDVIFAIGKVLFLQRTSAQRFVVFPLPSISRERVLVN